MARLPVGASHVIPLLLLFKFIFLHYFTTEHIAVWVPLKNQQRSCRILLEMQKTLTKFADPTDKIETHLKINDSMFASI